MSDAKTLCLAEAVQHALDQYFDDLNGEYPSGLHKMVMLEVERPLITYVMEKTDGNQTDAARILGINRNTLR
ncbi:MAG: Fis family transcriptional regulator, partial [Parvicella sp.]